MAFVIALLALLAVGRDRMMRDPGTFWHTVVGDQILRTAELPTADTFTFTENGRPWIAQQWLAECVMALVHRVAGLDGLLLGAAVVLAATFALLAGRFSRAGLGGLTLVLPLMLVAGASSYHFLPRPHLATIFFMAWTLALLCDVESGRKKAHCLYGLPLLFVVWTNLHGGVLGGIVTLLCVLGAWLVLPVGLRSRCRVAPPLLGVVACLCLASVLVNPYGPRLPALWLGLMGSDVLPKTIVEHAPLNLLSIEGLMILALAAAYLALLVKTWHTERRVTWLIPLLWFVMALTRVRHGPLFAVTAAVAIADMLPHASFLIRLGGSTIGTPPRTGLDPADAAAATPSRWTSLAPIALVLLALVLQAAEIRVPLIGAGWARIDPERWPVEATAALSDYTADGPAHPRVFNDMLYGGYLIYHMPQTRVFIDDRCELHGDWGLTHYADIRREPTRLDALAPYDNIQFAMIRTGSRVDRHLDARADWRLLHRDRTASLHERLGP